MKKIKIPYKLIISFIIISICFGGFLTAGFTMPKAENINHTGYFDTGYRTRFSGTVSKKSLLNKQGASISFDLLYSDLKQPENVVVGNTFNDIKHISHYTCDSYGGITFTFYRYSDNMELRSWLSSFNPQDRVPTSFTYYGDGQLFTFHGHDYESEEGDNRTRRKITNLDSKGNLQINPEERNNVVGEVEDFKAFMEQGFSYRIKYFFGDVTDDKVLVPSQNEDAKAWYVVERKAIYETDDSFSVLFAFKNLYSNARKQINGVNFHAGFEILANAVTDNIQPFNQGSYNTNSKSTNIKMELDNIAIYDGYDFNTSHLKTIVDFEDVNDFDLTDDENVKSVNSINATSNPDNFDVNKVALGDIFVKNEKVSTILVDWTNETGMNIITCNAAKELMHDFSKRSIKDYDSVEVTFKNKANDEVICNFMVNKGSTIVAPSQNTTIMPFLFEMPTAPINEDMVIYGEIDRIKLQDYTVNFDNEIVDCSIIPYGDNQAINAINGNKYTMGGNVVFTVNLPQNFWVDSAFINDIPIELDENLSFSILLNRNLSFIVKTATQHTINFLDGDNIIKTAKVNTYEDAFSVAPIPEKEGYTFMGWDKLLSNVTADTDFTAVFKKNYDDDSNNKTLQLYTSGSGCIKFGRELDKSENLVMSYSFGKLNLADCEMYAVINMDTNQEIKINLMDFVDNNTTIKIKFNKYDYEIFTKMNSQNDNCWISRYKGAIFHNYNAGFYGLVVNFHNDIRLQIDSMSIYNGSASYTDFMNYDSFIVDENIAFKTMTQVFSSRPLSLTSLDTPRNIEVSFVDSSNNQVVAVHRLSSGDNTAYPVIKGYSYTWDKTLDNLMGISDNIVVKGTPKQEAYSITFKGVEMDKLDNLHYQDKVILNSLTKNDYVVIKGWSETENGCDIAYPVNTEFSMPNKSLILYPIWDIKQITVTFTSEDNSELCKILVPYGATAIYSGINPVKQGYQFVGWDKSLANLTYDIIVKPIFESKKQFNCAIDNINYSYKIGDKVNLYPMEKVGFKLDDIIINGAELVEENGEQYFIMPTSDVTIEYVYSKNISVENILLVVSIVLASIAVIGVIVSIILSKKGKQK